MTLQVLRRNPGFARLWGAQVISQAGDWLNRVAILALISDLGGGAGVGLLGLMYGVEFAVRLLPTSLMAPLAGAVADRLSRKWILILADLSRALVVLGMLQVENRTDLPLLYGLLMAQMGLAAFFEAAKAATLPSLVRDGDLMEAYSLSALTWSVMLAVGALSGGLLLSVLFCVSEYFCCFSICSGSSPL